MILNRLLLLFLWLITILIAIVWSFENPEKIEKIKSYFNKEQLSEVEIVNDNVRKVIANSFELEVEKVLSLENKSAFIINNNKENEFNPLDLEIYTQNGTIIKNLKPQKMNLPDYFTLQRNGGVKTIISFEDKKIALISSNKKDCFYASLILLENKNELICE